MPLRRSHVRACARRGVQPAQQARTLPLDGFPVNWLDVAFEGHNLAMAESPAFAPATCPCSCPPAQAT